MNTMEREYWKVSDVAELAHVTVRTLHHYDRIGLLVPSQRSGAGYRLYSASDLERLYQILMYRELGFPLEGIARMIDASSDDRSAALRTHRDLLVEGRRRTDAVIRAVDRALESMERSESMSSKDIFEGFDAFANAPEAIRAHQAEHGAESMQRWGDADAYRESMRRARGFTKDDWKSIEKEAEANEVCMAALLASAADPAGADAMAGAEAMREHISRWFYPCDYGVHAGLADMYEADPRFAAHYDERAEGLAAFVAAAIRANAARALKSEGQ